MKLEKRVDKEEKVDVYIVYIPHKEADMAFDAMTPFEKRYVMDLQKSNRVADHIKALEFWVHKIEEIKLNQKIKRKSKSVSKYDG